MNHTTVTHDLRPATMQRIDRIWDEMSDSVAAAFRMSEEEKARFKTKDIAKLIGTLPFIAGCQDAERTAVTHLGSYVLSFRETKPYFNANPSENTDVFERLRLGMNFKGGDPRIIDKGMSILALIMLNDYHEDLHIDDAIGKYNPVADGSFDYPSLKAQLEKKIQSIESPEIDGIICGDMGTKGYWGV